MKIVRKSQYNKYDNFMSKSKKWQSFSIFAKKMSKISFSEIFHFLVIFSQSPFLGDHLAKKKISAKFPHQSEMIRHQKKCSSKNDEKSHWADFPLQFSRRWPALIEEPF